MKTLISKGRLTRKALFTALAAAAGVGSLSASSVFAVMPVQPAEVWTDASGNNLWDTSASVNWSLNGLPTTFSANSAVIFNDSSGPGHYNVTISPVLVHPSSVSVNNSLGDYVFTGSATCNIGNTLGNTGIASLTKLGVGNLTLATSTGNTYSGNTTVSQGTLVLDFSNFANPANLNNMIKPTTNLIMGGGTLITDAATLAAVSQTFAGTLFSSGASTIAVNANASAIGTLNLGAISRNVGATVDFTLPALGSSINTTTANTNGILGGYATVGGGTWAVSGGDGTNSGVITGLTNYDSTWAPGNNTDVTSTGTANGNITNSLRFDSNSSVILTLAGTQGSVDLIQSGGILVTSNAVHGASIFGPGITSGNGQDLIVVQNSSAPLLIQAKIVDNASVPIGLTLSGSGTLDVTNTGNTYTGPTTINNGILNISSIANGGTASSIGESGNIASNLVINGGTLQYVGATIVTDRLLTVGPGGATIDASGEDVNADGSITFAGNLANGVNTIAFSADTVETLTLTGVNSGNNTFAPIIPDPDITGQYKTSLVKNGSGMWILTNNNTYSGGTTINGGVLKVNNTSGSGTGTGPVTVNATASLGGSGFIGGPVTFLSGSILAPGDANNLTINNNLTLSAGAGATYFFDQPNTPGLAGNNDLTTVTGVLAINPNLTVNVTTGANFGDGNYTLIHYNTLTDNSAAFQGWNADVNWSAAPAGTYYTFAVDAAQDNVNLVVANAGSGPIPTPIGGPPITVPLPPSPGPQPPIGDPRNPPPIILLPGGPGGGGGGGGGGNPVVNIGPINNNNGQRQNLNANFRPAPAGPQNIININNVVVNANAVVLAPVLNLVIAPKINGQFVGFAYPVEWPAVTLPVTFPGANAAAAVANANAVIQNIWMTTDSVGVMNVTPFGLLPAVYSDIIPAGWGTESLAQAAALSPFANANGSDPLNPRVPDPVNTTFAAYLAGLPAGTLWTDIDGGWGAAAFAAAPDPNNPGQWFIATDMWAVLDYDVPLAPVAPTPEPASLGVLGISSLALLARRRRR